MYNHYLIKIAIILNMVTRNDINISDYKYSVSNLALTKEQRDFYEKNGYLVIPKLIPDYLLDRCWNRFVDLCHGRIPNTQITCIKDVSRMKAGYKNENLIIKLNDTQWDDEFYEYARYPKLIDYIESFIGPDVMAMHSMYLNKLPDIGTNSTRHPIHQDLHIFPFRPANLIVASWTACVPVTEDNGCLYVIPGSHTGELYRHSNPEPKDGEINKLFYEMKNNDYDNHEKVFLKMDKGDTVFFHPLLVHGSGINKTEEFRKAISVHYASSKCYYIDLRRTFQYDILNELSNSLNKTSKKKFDYINYWKLRARLIRGIKANL